MKLLYKEMAESHDRFYLDIRVPVDQQLELLLIEKLLEDIYFSFTFPDVESLKEYLLAE